MTPERWHAVGELFTRALAEPPERRAAWLAAVPAAADVRRDVAALLEAHVESESEAFLEAPARLSEPTAAAVADPALFPGAVLGPYHLVRVLGQGGMGVVFEAEDTRLHRRVALKAVVTPPGSGDPGQRRLRQEARAAAALEHPNIATVYALEDIDGRSYIASEYLEGETLREVLARGPLSRDETLATAIAVARALEAAHARGIVHRDLKPENVLRLADGRVKILDFGLAQFVGEARDQMTVSRLTQAGLAAGTPGYMAPEQFLGQGVDGRADQFALGVLLAEMAMGRNPFEATTLAATIAAVVQADGLPSVARAQLPADLFAIADRCTRQQVDDRFARIADVVEALEASARGEGVVAGPVRPSASGSAVRRPSAPLLDPATGRRSALWWWRFHQAAAAAIYWMMIVPAWLVHRLVTPGLPWFLGCLAATIVAANVRLHLRFSAAVLPAELPAQRARTRGWVAIADWTVIVLWAYAGAVLMEANREWSAVFVAFAIGAALAVGLIEPATTRAAFEDSPPRL